MNNSIILEIANKMAPFLNSNQMKTLQTVLNETLAKPINEMDFQQDSNLLFLFLQSKEIEGCSSGTITYYRSVLEKMTKRIGKPFPQISTEDLRNYLTIYQTNNNPSKVTLDNIRRIMSSFFSWLEDEDYIIKSPVRRIKRIKTPISVKETFNDEQIELLRDSCCNLRNRAIIELLSSTGIRIGELINLDREDINFTERECVVLGKGNKERRVYFDTKTKIHLQRYLESRKDNNPALFVVLNKTNKRITKGAIESQLRSIGKELNIGRVHPHKFRRTLATTAIDKGMPIEQVQQLLGHARIDTTMHYAFVKENNVKASHRKYLS